MHKIHLSPDNKYLFDTVSVSISSSAHWYRGFSAIFMSASYCVPQQPYAKKDFGEMQGEYRYATKTDKCFPEQSIVLTSLRGYIVFYTHRKWAIGICQRSLISVKITTVRCFDFYWVLYYKLFIMRMGSMKSLHTKNNYRNVTFFVWEQMGQKFNV